MSLAVARTDIDELLKNLTDGSPVGIYIMQDGRFCYVNPHFQRLTGYDEEELLGQDSLMLIAPEDREMVSAGAVKALQEETSSPHQIRVICKDGSVRSAMQIVSSVRYRGRRATLGYYMDLTERKNAEEALRQSEERYRTILEETGDGYFEADLAGNFTLVNDALLRLLGYSRDEMVGASYRVFTPADKTGSVFEAYNRVYETGEPLVDFPSEVIRKDGSIRFAETSAFPIRDDEGNIIGFRGVRRDVTERKRAEEALRQSEERYRTILEEMEDSYFEVDLGGHLTFVNNSTCRSLGYSQEELMGMSYKTFTTDDAIESVYRMFNDVYQTGSPNKGFAWRLTRKDGSHGFAETSVAPLRDDEGTIIGFSGIGRDITERSEMEEELRSQEAYFQQLFDNSPEAIVLLDTEDRVVRANRGFGTLFGYSDEDVVVGRPINELVIPDHLANQASASSRTVLHGGIVRKETVRRRKDGTLVDVSVVGYPVRLDSELVAMYVMYSDITRRKRMEEALKHAAEEWRETFDSMSEAISIHSEDCRLQRVNKAFAAAVHMQPRQLIGRHCYEVMHGTKEPVSGCPHRETLQTRKPARAEFFEPDSGVHLEITTSPLLDDSGEIVGTVHISRDVTKRKQQNEQLMMADRLASIGELASGTAHQLNNPLTSVIGFSQLLMERDVPDDIREDLELIYSEAQRAAEVIKNLLTFGRKHAPVKQLNQINRIIEDVLGLRAYEQRVNNIEVKRKLSSSLPEVMVDYFQMQQVFLNIIINAEHFMTQAHQGGTLTVTTQKRNGTVRISIADDGPGISPENLRQLFNPFFTTKPTGKGTGLGLSICHGIVSEHGGQIYATSRPGEGATFVIELPINGPHRGGNNGTP